MAILNDYDALQQEQAGDKPIPVVREVTPAMIQRNYPDPGGSGRLGKCRDGADYE